MSPELSHWDFAAKAESQFTEVTSKAAEGAEYSAPQETLTQISIENAVRINTYEIPQDKIAQIQVLMSEEATNKISLTTVQSILGDDPEFNALFANMQNTFNFVTGDPELAGNTLESKLAIGELEGNFYATPIIEVTGGPDTPPINSIVVTIDRKDAFGNLMGIEDLIFIDDDGQEAGINIDIRPLKIIDQTGAPLLDEHGVQRVQSVAFKTYTTSDGLTAIISTFSSDETEGAVENPLLTATVTVDDANVRGVDPLEVIGTAQEGQTFTVLAGPTPAPNPSLGELYTVLLPNGGIANLSNKVINVHVNPNVDPNLFSFSIPQGEFSAFDPSENAVEFPAVTINEEPEVAIIQADYEHAYRLLPESYQQRAALPKDNPDHIEYSQKYQGFMNAQGEVWRRGAVRGNLENMIEAGWYKEAVRETFQLTDEEGKPFSWTITIEKPADRGIGLTQADDVEFTDEFRRNLNTFASKFLRADVLNGQTLRIISVSEYYLAPETTAGDTYLQSLVNFPDGDTYLAMGINRYEDSLEVRAYNGYLGGEDLRLYPDETREQFEEFQLSSDIDGVMRMVATATSEEFWQKDTWRISQLLRIDDRAVDMTNTILPHPLSAVGNLNQASYLVRFKYRTPQAES